MLIKSIQSSNSICLHFNIIFFHLSFTLWGLQNDFALGRKKKKNLLGVGRVRIAVLVQGWDSSWVLADSG